MPAGIAALRTSLGRVCLRTGDPNGRPFHLTVLAFGPRYPRASLHGRTPGEQIVTWLILPVVICLSQRLSHACLSISNYTVKLRMAH